MSCCPAPSAGRGSLRAWLATAQVLALPGTGGHGGRDRGAAQVAGRTGPRRRCPHNPVPLAATPPAPKRRGPVCVFDLEDDEASRLYRAPAAQAAQVLLRAELSNECWQADTTHWSLSDGTDVEVLNIIDDRSRLLVASRASLTTKPADVVATFEAAGTEVGLPASLLTDNVAIFMAESRGGRCAIETLLLALGGSPTSTASLTTPDLSLSPVATTR
jgi:hypothetical protein